MQEKRWDEIRIENLEVFAHHGVLSEEKENGQAFYVNATLFTDLRKAGIKDDLTFSTHYGEVCSTIEMCMKERIYDLIEAAAEETARRILLTYPLVRGVDLEVRKPNAPIPAKFDSVSVKISRWWHRAYVAFGSNMGDSEGLILEAKRKLAEDEAVRMGDMSRLAVTKPYGGVEQVDFLNAACFLDTLYTPHELLDRLHEIEAQAGRVRKVHWGPRTLDLDIILYDDIVCHDRELTIPHADMQNRFFVLEPMAEIAPYARHPLSGKTMEQMLEELKSRERAKNEDA